MASPIPVAIRPETAQTAPVRPRAASMRTTGRVRWRLIHAAWLMLAMVVAQTMGFVHGTAHVHLHHGGHQPAVTITPQSAGSVAAALEQLFDDHDDEAQCRLYDQVSRGDCAPTAEMASAASLPVAPLPAETAVPWPCSACLPARARGPPRAG